MPLFDELAHGHFEAVPAVVAVADFLGHVEGVVMFAVTGEPQQAGDDQLRALALRGRGGWPR